MPPIPVDRFMASVLEDEGWMSGLSDDAVATVIARLEEALPPGSELTEDRAAQLRAGLRELGAFGRALAQGSLHEAGLIEGCLRLLEV
jgi:hypothetical protein